MGATSKAQIERRRKAKRAAFLLILSLLMLLSGFVGYIFWSRFQVIFQARAELESLKAEKQKLLEENRELEDRLDLRNDLEYIRELAEEQLGFVAPEDEEPEKGDGD
ncbi:MAG: FtsB family cell division protein [Candidatus Bipolaricaulota bacterium]